MIFLHFLKLYLIINIDILKVSNENQVNSEGLQLSSYPTFCPFLYLGLKYVISRYRYTVIVNLTFIVPITDYVLKRVGTKKSIYKITPMNYCMSI